MFWGEKSSEHILTADIEDGLCNVNPRLIEMEEEQGAEDVGAKVEWIEVIGNVFMNPELANK